MNSTLEARFNEKVDRSGGPDACWPWLGSCVDGGYGQLYRDTLDGKTRMVRAHRLAWEFAHGPIPSGLKVLHRCDNPPCCNPAHLFLGTDLDNAKDRVAKGRSATGDRAGARLYPDRRPRGELNGARLHPETRPRGEANGIAKLSAENVLEIRRSYAAGEATQVELGARFGIAHSTVGRILRGQGWNHV